MNGLSNYPAGVDTNRIDALCVEQDVPRDEDVSFKYLDVAITVTIDNGGDLESVCVGDEVINNLISAKDWEAIEEKAILVWREENY